MSAPLSTASWQRWRPKLLECLPGYGRHAFVSDLVAGLTVGVVALPLAMALASRPA